MASVLWNKRQQSRLLKNLGLRTESAALQSFWRLMGMLSPERASAIGDWLLRRVGPRTSKFHKVKANLAMAFPDKDAEEIDRIARGCMGNLGAVMAELAHMKKLVNASRANPYVEIINLNDDPHFNDHSRPCIFVSAHLGNWELAAYAAVAFGHETDVVYTPLSNPWIDRLIAEKRALMGAGTLSRSNVLRTLLKSLKQGHSVGILTDVRVDDTNLLPFFGTGAGISRMPAWLSMKTGYDIVPAYCVRTGHARFRFTFYPSLTRPPEGTTEEEGIRMLSMQMIRMHELRITEHPDQWVCTNRRWPKHVMRERGIY